MTTEASVLPVPPQWRTLAFLSDIHLHPADPDTFEVWRHYMASPGCDAMFILGDLFEVWVGDDILGPSATLPPEAQADAAFWRTCADVLRQTANRLPVYFLAGNRDFLVGQGTVAATGIQLLPDPTVLAFEQPTSSETVRCTLSHGDALCLDDQTYQAFRAQVRTAAWQQQFLAKPLGERLALARHMREASEQRKTETGYWADVDAGAVNQWLAAHGSQWLIHGHTHQPAVHRLPDGHLRHVLTDWSASTQPHRAAVLEVQPQHAATGMELKYQIKTLLTA